jgi:hypothetical protein
MRLQRLRDRLNNERGNVLLFTFTLLVFLLVMGGFAIDFAYQVAARTELQRTIDAAALAGAGKLGFDDTVFPTCADYRSPVWHPESPSNRHADAQPQHRERPRR